MKRRDFLRRFGIGAAAAVVAPAVVKEVMATPAPEPVQPFSIFLTEEEGIGVWEQMREENIRPHHAQYPLTYDEAFLKAQEGLRQALDRELFLGTGDVTEQSLKGIFR